MTSRSSNHQKLLLNKSLNLVKSLIVCGLLAAGLACVPIHELGDGPSSSECSIPQYSNACEDVDYFQCGVTPSCHDGVLRVDWHEHVFCGGHGDEYPDEGETEELGMYSCQYKCEHGCADLSDEQRDNYEWDSASMIALFCAPEPQQCPDDLAAAAGQACTQEGVICNANGDHEACSDCSDEDCESLRCEGGQWQLDRVPACTEAECEIPNYPSECEDVDYFQYGLNAICEDGVIDADWEEDSYCFNSDGEYISEEGSYGFSCTHSCEFGCRAVDVDDAGYNWPHNGRELVEALCATSL